MDLVINTAEIARRLGLSREHVTDRLIKQPEESRRDEKAADSIELRLRRVEDALIALTQAIAPRLDRTQLAERFGIHRNTLRVHLARDRTFPRPGTDGRWLLREVIEWEMGKARLSSPTKL